jgi:membrane protease YdiL (CAAX protease family)
MKIHQAFLQTIILVAIQSLITVIITLIFKQIYGDNQDAYFQLLGLNRTFVQITGYLIVFLLFWKPFSSWISNNDLKIDDFKIITLIIIIGIGFEFLKSPFHDFENIINYLKNTDLKYYSNYFDGFDRTLVYRATGAIIIAPVFEELFFRKYLISKLITRNSRTLTLLISSICFALIHFETPNNIIPAFLFGIGSGIIYLNTKKIGYSILFHFFSNSLWLIDLVLGDKFYNFLFSLEFNFIYWMISIIGLIISIIGIKKITTDNNV